MEYTTIFFVVIIAFIALTFFLEVVKPKLELRSRNKKFENRGTFQFFNITSIIFIPLLDYSKDTEIRDQLAKKKQEEVCILFSTQTFIQLKHININISKFKLNK